MAIHYFNSAKDCFISTNYKVWFTTLEKQDCLEKATDEGIWQNQCEAEINPEKRKKHFLLVRNPYKRLESFFRDKFRKHPMQGGINPAHEWQHCQRLFFAPLQIRQEDPIPLVREKLLACSFDNFMQLLPGIWEWDEHLIPQFHAFFLFTETETLRLHYDKFLQVESADDIGFLSRELGIDPTIVRNSTQDLDMEIEWSAENRDMVNRIYSNDFLAFNYSKITGVR